MSRESLPEEPPAAGSALELVMRNVVFLVDMADAIKFFMRS